MITILITLVICGVCLWLLETYVPLDPAIKTVIRVVVVLFLIIFLLNMFGIVHIPMNLK
jgi:hypothetical protein